MIKKIYRLKEKEIWKVFKWRPFFSYWFVANTKNNKLEFPRFAIIFSGKNTKTSVDRNFYRRKFYDISSKYLDLPWIDMVFIPKKWSIFDRRNEETVANFEQDINFVLKKIKKEFLKNN